MQASMPYWGATVCDSGDGCSTFACEKKLPKTTVAWWFWIWLFVTFNFHSHFANDVLPASKVQPGFVSGFHVPFHDPNGNFVARADLRQTPGELQGKPFQYLGSADGVRRVWLFETFFSPRQNLLEERWTPLKSLWYVSIVSSKSTWMCQKPLVNCIWFDTFFSQSTLTWFFLVPNASTWFLRNEMTSIKISIFVNFLEPPKAEHNCH